MKRKAILLVFVVLMSVLPAFAAVSANVSVELSKAGLSYEEDKGYDLFSFGGSFSVCVADGKSGLRLGANIGYGISYNAILDGHLFNNRIFNRFHRVNTYHASISASYVMPVTFGVYAELHGFWHDAVFTGGLVLNNWKRISFHSFGLGCEAGFSYKVGTLRYSLGFSYDKLMKTFTVARERHNWDTSAGIRTGIYAQGCNYIIKFAVSASY